MKALALKLLFISFLFQITRPALHAQCPDIHPDDLAALQALYNATGGDSWTDNTGWDQITGPTMICDLNNIHGVFFAGNRVSFILLQDNNLTGTLPAELGNLSQVIQFELPINNLTGNIPASLGNLSLVERLNLFDNNLSGQIPGELGNLSNLEVLALNKNALSGRIPRQLGNLSNLTFLLLNDNMLSGHIPSQLGNLSNLEILSLHSNNLSGGIPSRFRNLANLKQLTLYSNSLSGNLPSFLGDLSTLESIELGDNQFRNRIPSELGNLNALVILNLSHNSLRMDIPPELGMLSNLEELLLQENQLSGSIPGELGDLSSLTLLRLDGNDLSGCFDSNLSSLCGITVFIDDAEFDASWADFCTSMDGVCPPPDMPVIDLPTVEVISSHFTAATDKSTSIPRLFQNRPNPFQEVTTIPFYIPGPDHVHISLYDLNGTLLKTWEGQVERGYYEIPVRRDELAASGVVVYRLITGNESLVKCMVLKDL